MTQQYPPPQHGQYPPHLQAPPPKKKRRWPWIVLGAVVLLFFLAALGGNSNPAPTTPAAGPRSSAAAPAQAAPDAAGGSTVVYEVIGQGKAGNVTYSKEGFSQEQQTNVALPFRKELQFKDEVGQFSGLSIVAQNGSRGGDITCRITVDGKVVGESTSNGQYAVVTCNNNG